MEVKVPFSVIGIKNKISLLGLGVDLIDNDGNGKPALLSWTGNYMPRESPFGFGELILK